MLKIDKEILQESIDIIIQYSNDIIVLKEQKKIINRVLRECINILEATNGN